MLIELEIDKLSVVTSILGGYIILYGLVSFFIKERLYLSEARKYMFIKIRNNKIFNITLITFICYTLVVSMITGIIFGPIALGLLNPANWGHLDQITNGFLRIIIGIQVG